MAAPVSTSVLYIWSDFSIPQQARGQTLMPKPSLHGVPYLAVVLYIRKVLRHGGCAISSQLLIRNRTNRKGIAAPDTTKSAEATGLLRRSAQNAEVESGYRDVDVPKS
jgi:hypothetical protein